MTPRVNAIRRFDYTVKGVPIEPKPELVLQTEMFELDDHEYWLKNNGQRWDSYQDCVNDGACLADVDIYKYKDSKNPN
jgi:hypothetical protein